MCRSSLLLGLIHGRLAGWAYFQALQGKPLLR
jgi:hypothetical protein